MENASQFPEVGETCPEDAGGASQALTVAVSQEIRALEDAERVAAQDVTLRTPPRAMEPPASQAALRTPPRAMEPPASQPSPGGTQPTGLSPEEADMRLNFSVRLPRESSPDSRVGAADEDPCADVFERLAACANTKDPPRAFFFGVPSLCS